MTSSIASAKSPTIHVYTYDLAGNRITLTYPNQVVTTYGYDQRNRLGGLTTASGGNILARFVQVTNKSRRTRGHKVDLRVPQPFSSARDCLGAFRPANGAALRFNQAVLDSSRGTGVQRQCD